MLSIFWFGSPLLFEKILDLLILCNSFYLAAIGMQILAKLLETYETVQLNNTANTSFHNITSLNYDGSSSSSTGSIDDSSWLLITLSIIPPLLNLVWLAPRLIEKWAFLHSVVELQSANLGLVLERAEEVHCLREKLGAKLRKQMVEQNLERSLLENHFNLRLNMSRLGRKRSTLHDLLGSTMVGGGSKEAAILKRAQTSTGSEMVGSTGSENGKIGHAEEMPLVKLVQVAIPYSHLPKCISLKGFDSCRHCRFATSICRRSEYSNYSEH